MTLFDFSKLSRPTSGSKPTNPIEIFRTAPALEQTPNDLWQGQSKALEQWDAKRDGRDVLVSLHTGAGKSLVGLLIAQSLINEGLSKVLYVCATIDLIIQTSKEINKKLGFDHTTRMRGEFSNDLYATGRAFCVTNYQALFNSRTTFRGDLRPEAIIFDDAHVAEKIIRDAYTVRIDKSSIPDIYEKIVDLLRPHFSALSRSEFFDEIVRGTSVHRVALAPPSASVALGRSGDLIQILRRAEAKDKSLGFSLGHIADHLSKCVILISQDAVEIAPALLPSRRISFLNDPDIRRIYLSATLTSEVDFCRAFGRRPAIRIEPVSDAGIGERLVILADQEKLKGATGERAKDEAIARLLSSQNKLLICTPTYVAAKKYEALSIPPKVDEFSERLEVFRNSTSAGAFVLVGRIDGIDLPHATCRVMLVDGLPTGFSLFESYLFDYLEMRNAFAAKLANRVTQLFGRTNRGRNDYSVIFITDRRFITWLSAPRNQVLLPELLQKQVLLGKSLVDQFQIDDMQKFLPLVKQVIERDGGWLNYYKDSISGMNVGEDEKQQAGEINDILTEAALVETEFAAYLWDNSLPQAREALGQVVDKVVVADRKLAAWYNILIGHTFEVQGDGEAAAKQYSEAKSRTNVQLALPNPATTQSIADPSEAKHPLQKKLLQIFANDIKIQNAHIARHARAIQPLFDETKTANQHEEALRALGELLGFEASRPEQETDTGSTLDVLWTSSFSNQAILFSLKTKKKTNTLNMDEVGQGHNHLQWIKSSKPEITSLGLVFVCDSQSCTSEAAPSPDMYTARVADIKSLYDQMHQQLLALQRMIPLERYSEINELARRADWQPEIIFKRLGCRKLAGVEGSMKPRQ